MQRSWRQQQDNKSETDHDGVCVTMHRLHHSLHPAGTVRQALHMSWKQQTEEWDEDRKIPESVLKRSVFKQIRTKRPEVLVGAGVGEDCAVMKLAEDEVFVLSTRPITGTAKDMGELAVHVTANDLASAGAEPVGMLLTVLLPESVEGSGHSEHDGGSGKRLSSARTFR